VTVTTFTAEIGNRICAELSAGKSLRSVCTEFGLARQTVFDWLRRQPEFAEQYAIAKEESADYLAEEMLEIADDRSEDPQSRRVRVDTRKWIASKMKPKKYGEKLDVNGKFDGTLQLSGSVVFVEPAAEKGK
jgi:transposase-like protein